MPRLSADKPLNAQERAEIAFWRRQPTAWDDTPLTNLEE